MPKPPALRPLAILSACALLLVACGGGGGGTAVPTEPVPTTALGSSRQYEEAVAGCSADTQKKFVRSYLDQYYLWYDEIVDVDPALYPGRDQVDDYFHALLVRTPDATGLPKDRFSAVLPTASVVGPVGQSALAQQASPATAQASHTRAVPEVKTVTSPDGRRAGYIRFNDHEIGAQDDLIAAFRQIQAAAVQDLVLDLRFNSGGFLYIARTAASMITGPSSEGQVFERLQYNAKRPFDTAVGTFLFSSRVQIAETQNPVGTQLPQLGLSRVFVLTSGATCSASESIINGLRGIDVQVIQIGTTTCGKPYGFHEKTNCGWSFFPIAFQGTNAKGFGDYTTGLAPTCEVQDNSAVEMPGGSSDTLLAGALHFMDTGACPDSGPAAAQAAAVPKIGGGAQPNRPAWAGRLLLPQER